MTETEKATKARHLLKTAYRANESKNYKREAELLEEAIMIMPDVTAHVLRRYASALYKCGEYRAAGIVVFNDKCLDEAGEGFVSRLRGALEKKGIIPFLDIAKKCEF